MMRSLLLGMTRIPSTHDNTKKNTKRNGNDSENENDLVSFEGQT